MTALDPRTTLLIIGFLYLIMPTVVWIVLAQQRSLAVALWCLGGLITAVVSIMTAMQNLIPVQVYFNVAALLFHGSILIRIHSLRLDLGIGWPARWIVLVLVGILLIANSLDHVLDAPVLRAQFHMLVVSVLLFYMAHLALLIDRKDCSPSARWIARVYFLVAVAFLYRFFALSGFEGEIGIVREGLSTQIIVFSLMLAAVLGHLSYVGLHLDRAMRRELEAVANLAREEESRPLRTQIAHLDRQRSLGAMSASLGHELNQPLTAILTNAEVALRGLQSGRLQAVQHSEILARIIKNTQRATQIIERIRGFIQPAAVRHEPVDLLQVVREVKELVADEVRTHDVSLVFSPQSAPLRVMGDPIQISQIVLNMLRNAIQALQQARQREIRVSCTLIDGRAVLRIHDTGHGLTPEALEKVGAPFFSTKPDGLGMGFTISRTIAIQHGGTLNIANAEGGGALVELILPALSDSVR